MSKQQRTSPVGTHPTVTPKTDQVGISNTREDTANLTPPVPHTVSRLPDYSLALVSPGDRTDRMTQGLEAVGAEFRVNPADPTTADVVICDTPDRAMLKTIARCRLAGTPVLFRMRGDPFFGLSEWLDSRLKRQVVYRMLRAVDGCLAIAPHQATKYARKTGVPTEIVSLPKQPTDWPDTTHQGEELQLLTLTNAVYQTKTEPLVEIAQAVDCELRDGETWRIGSWSEGHSDYLRDVFGPYEHIEYETQLDAHAELDRATAMLHFSRMDVLPNAILEGMASRLPVVTNDFVAFDQSVAPLLVSRHEQDLQRWLAMLRDDSTRQLWGHRGVNYVRSHHAPERIGARFLCAIDRLLGNRL